MTATTATIPGENLTALLSAAAREALVEGLAYEWAIARCCADMRKQGKTMIDAELAAHHEGSVDGILHVAVRFGINGKEVAERGRVYLAQLQGVR